MGRQHKKHNAIFTKVVALIVVVFFVLIFAFKDNVLQLSSEFAMKLDNSNVAHADTVLSEFNYVLNNKSYSLTFLEFGATSCSACIAMEKVLDEIRVKFSDKVNVLFMNVTTISGDKYADYYKVMMIPTQIILNKEGQEVFRHTGFIDANELEKVFVKTDCRIRFCEE